MGVSAPKHMSHETSEAWTGPITLTSAEIHLWLAFYDEISEGLHSAYRQLLSATEREQETRFYFGRDSLRYLITRALVRIVLSRYVSIPPSEWIFSANAYGRPEIVNTQGRDACLSFNISHSHGLIVLGVTKQRALGVDVENFRVRRAPIEIADHYFTPKEVAALAAAPLREQQYRFFEYWTFKEAYIKARGMGLSLPLDKFWFQYSDDGEVEITIDPELADDAARWQFCQFQPAAGYLVAVCAERVGPQSPSLIVRRTIPILSEGASSFAGLRIEA